LHFIGLLGIRGIVPKINIKNLNLSQLRDKLVDLDLKEYRAQQVRQWLYQKQAAAFHEMTNIKKSVREILDQKFTIPLLTIKSIQKSRDGVIKFGLELSDGTLVEAVFIPSEGRNTLCVSSQVGCGMDCQFCLTAQMGLVRNLSLFEIVDQVGAIQRYLSKQGDERRISNLVFMGMGEPLANKKNLYEALEILMEAHCYGLSRQHITVSTVGLAPEIEKFGHCTPVKLAISLNATTNEVRDKLMPINKKYPIERLIRACQKMHLPKRNRITFEYVMLHGVNDTLDDAKRLIKILSQLKAKINLIPFNEYPGGAYKRPSDEWIHKFQKILLDKGFIANIRISRGTDIKGACGQLVTDTRRG
jgi:23S rRNA (adenine2503-C2)-methyltransferase